jgi:ribonuclease HII
MADFEIEKSLMRERNFTHICGIDEAGRGPWAGPVVACAIILDKDNIPEGLDDSKKLSHKKREVLFEQIQQSAKSYSIKFIDAQIIDEINILQATFKAMNEAFASLNIIADYALIDGNRDPKIQCERQTIIKGDGKSVSIAAASILAKVARDRYMTQMDEIYPQYGFAQHKGYGVALHHDALKKYGPCPLHRTSFKPIKELISNIKS